MKRMSPEETFPAPQNRPAEDLKRRKKIIRSFHERGGRTIKAEPLNPEESDFVRRKYKDKKHIPRNK